MSLCGLPGCSSKEVAGGVCAMHRGLESYIAPPHGTPEAALELPCTACGTEAGVPCKSDCSAKAWATVPSALAPESEPEISERGAGLKFDGGKPRWTLLMQGMAYALGTVVAVLSFGAAKYKAHSWREVENGKERYRDALYRHMAAYEQGELVDPESGLPHLAHVATNTLFLLELDKLEKKP